MTNTNEWRVNDGTVPECVGPDTVIEAEYLDGTIEAWKYGQNHHECYWTFDGFEYDIIRWRFV